MEISFGNYGKTVSKLGLGLAALGRPGYINIGHGSDLNFNYEVSSMQTNAESLLDLAIANGVRYFDVARSYGKAEMFLGNWLKKNGLYNKLVIGSKWGYRYTADWKVSCSIHEIKDHSFEMLLSQFQETLNNLGRTPDIYHIHSATLESNVLSNASVINQLWKIRENEVIIGLSLSGPHQAETLEKALTLKIGNEYLFGSVQVTWNVLEQSATNILMEVAKLGWGIIVKEALANGRLTHRNNFSNFSDKLEQLKVIAAKYNTQVDSLCLAYVLHQSWPTLVLSGATTPAQLLSNLKAIEIKIDPTDLSTISDLVQSPVEYWTDRSKLSWN